MNCSIINDAIQLHIEDARQEIQVLLQRGLKSDPETKMAAGSALQNPDVSRLNLIGMLRRARQESRDSAISGQKNYWIAFMESTRSRCANANNISDV